MNQTKRHIAYLLESRGFVEVPSIGTFMRQHRSASIDGTRILPPADIISLDFNPDNCESIELQHSIMRAESADSEKAFSLMSENIGDIHQEINNSEVSQIDGVGSLYRRNKQLILKPIANDIEFGYPEIELKNIQRSTEVGKSIVLQDNDFERETFMRSLRRTASAAAAIAIFVFITFIVSQIPGRQSMATQASFSFETPQTAPATFPTTEQSQSDNASLILIFNTPADASSPVEYENKNTEPKQSVSDARYCLVVASLANQAEADKYMTNAAPGLTLLEKDGRYRVYILEANTSEELMAKANAADIYKTYPSAWVCRK